MMNLDEAIKYHREQAIHFYDLVRLYEKNNDSIDAQMNHKKAKEHEQLAEWLSDYSDKIKPRGTYQCFHCLTNGVIWDSDFDFSDYGLEGEGIIHVCHCTNCGAEIEYRVPCVESESDEDETSERNSN